MRILSPVGGLAAVAALALPAVAVLPGTAGAASPDVVISEVYGGGGNSGATYTHDFVELYNRGSTPVALDGWSVQYASAAGTTWSNTISLAGTLQPGGRYLVQAAQGAGGTTPLPPPDASGTVAMSATSGKVALVTSTASLACGADCDHAEAVRDFVGYGSANDFEASPAPTLSNTTSAQRAGGVATDTDDNGADFVSAAPTPQSSGEGGGGVTARIRDIQGVAHRSPMAGEQVSDVPGVVTAVARNGFWFQDPEPDADEATSDGLFVFTSRTPTVEAGDSVTVSGVVAEFRPGGASSTNLTTTEITSPQVTVLSSGEPLPVASLVGSGGRVPPSAVIDDDATGDVETSGSFDATADGIDFWESMEGMRVGIADAQVVGPTNDFGEIPVVPSGSGVRTDRGGIVVQPDDFNPERVLLNDTLLDSMPVAQVGDTLAGTTTGVLDYSFANFNLLPTSAPAVTSGGLGKESAAASAPHQLAVATYNVENLDPTDPQSRFDAHAATIVHRLRSPHIVALEEIQDNDGAANTSVVAADRTLDQLVAAIDGAGGPAYSWRQIDPVEDQDGGEPGGNIRVALLYQADKGLDFIDRPGGTSTRGTSVAGSGASTRLTFSPGRVEPSHAAWAASRKPLAAEFRYRGDKVFVIANHFSSKGGDDPLFGRFQPANRATEAQRHEQARVVRGFVDDLLTADPSARVVVAGDVNDFEFSETADILVGSGTTALTDLPRTLPQPERYTYVFQGNAQVLDHILLSPSLSTYAYDVVHVNAEFTDQVSDHDPQVVRLTF